MLRHLQYPVSRSVGIVICLMAGAIQQSRPAEAAITLAAGGQTRYVIAVAPDASPAVRHAAQELSDDLGQMTGATFPVAATQPGGPAIYVGPGPDLPRAFRNIRLASLPDEGFVIRTSGSNLFLAGSSDRGTLYAVYTFLEEQLGARWYAPDATVLPHHDSVRLPDLNEQQSPGFGYRDTDEHIVFGAGPWDAHLKLNGTDVPDQPELGGNNRLFNGAENFYGLVPPAKYFATHPEYFSLRNGKRDAAGDSQLCLTNPDVLRIVTDALVAQAKADPKLLVLGLSPNDAPDGNCQCDNCKASDALYGAPSGTLIHFVNQVAAAVQAALPGRKIWVETLAYQYTEKAPTPGSIAPANNVLVCLAPIYACVGHPLETDPKNVHSKEALLAWSKVAAGHLQVWHYVTNFANYLQPFPDWDELGADMPYYQANGVSGVFCEGDYSSAGGEMVPMRTWVMAHLFWNPHQDVWKLVKDYTDGYYGPAGADIYQYLRLMHDRLQQPDVHLFIYDGPRAPYLAPDLMAQANALLDHALAAANTPETKSRVEEVRLGPRYVELMTHEPGPNAMPDEKAAYKAKLDPFVADLRRFNVGNTSEGGSTDRWVEAKEKLAQ